MSRNSTSSREGAPRPRATERRAVWLLSAVVLAASYACGDAFVHSNPYDPDAPVTITIDGPDSLFSFTEIAHFTAHSTPALPDTAFQYASSDSFRFEPAGPQTFEAGVRVAPPLYPLTSTVTVSAGVGAIDTQPPTGGSAIGQAPHITIWRHTGYKQVVLTQRLVRLLLRCPDSHACDTLSAGGVWSVWADGFDALNHKVPSLASATANPLTGSPLATFAVRDTTIATFTPVGIRVATVTARKTGSTWIVATRGNLLDSLPLSVR